MPHYSLFINGAFKDTDKKQEIVNPAKGEIIATVSVAGENEIDSALDAARNAFDNGPWTKLSLKERKEFLLEISQGILEKAGDLAKLETLNNGKPIKESTFMDVPSAAATFEHFANNLEKYLKEEEIKVSDEVESRLIREPQGVVVLIVPWNYPLLIASWKMAQALAAGNTVILKPSSLTPLTVLELAKIIKDAGLPAGVVNIINGSGQGVGQMFCSDSRTDMISFTGSNEVGRKIIEYSSRSVKKLIMELGGKSASIVLKDVDVETAVNSCLCSIFLNQGQMCTAMSRILVEEDIYDKFTKDFVNKAKRIEIGDGLDYQTQMGPLVSDEQRKKIISFVKKAKDEGAKLLYGGNIPNGDKLKKGFFFEPTIFSETQENTGIFQEEIFGPVVCVRKFSGLDEAISLANNSNFGLAASIWTKDQGKANILASKLNAGIIWTNTYGMFHNEVPYGGFKQSGFGKELGKEGFLEYTRLKNVVSDKTKDSKPLVNYWYGF